MSAHEAFEQLCALAVTGDLEPEEFGVLGAHLYECAECRAAYRDFHALFEQGFPAREPDRKLRRFLPSLRMKRRFEKRAFKEGILIRRFNTGPALAGRIAGLATLTVVLLIAGTSAFWYSSRFANDQRTRATDQIAELTNRVEELERRLSEAESNRHVPVPPAGPVAVPDKNTTAELVKLRADYDAAVAARLELEQRLSSLSTELQELQSDSRTGESEIQRLRRDLDQAEAMLSRSNRDLESLRSTRSADLSTIAMQRARIDELASSIRQQADTIERERQLLAAGRDIRDLMGARNLRIVDVQDVGTPGKVRSIPGRIFYTQGKSLIFYVYDLQNKGNPKKVDFQVWGKKEGRSQPPRSLGILYVDDVTQNRWVLKFEDTAVLEQIDQVFVTAEPSGGSRQPTGKQLLTAAFLNDAPNHP